MNAQANQRNYLNARIGIILETSLVDQVTRFKFQPGKFLEPEILVSGDFTYILNNGTCVNNQLNGLHVKMYHGIEANSDI